MKHRPPSDIKEKKRFIDHSKKYRSAYLLQVNQLYGEVNDRIKEDIEVDKGKENIPKRRSGANHAGNLDD